MTMLASQITSLMVVYSIVYLGVNQRKHQSSASLAFVREIHRGPVNFPHKWPVTRKMFPLDDVIMRHGWPNHNNPPMTDCMNKTIKAKDMVWIFVWHILCWYNLISTSIFEIVHCDWSYILDSKFRVANMGPTWVLTAPGGPHVGPMNLAIRDVM